MGVFFLFENCMNFLIKLYIFFSLFDIIQSILIREEDAMKIENQENDENEKMLEQEAESLTETEGVESADTKEEQAYSEENINEDKKEIIEVAKEEPKKESTFFKKRHGIIFHIIAVLCIAMFCAAISPKCLQNDTYYTIAIGEYIYNNGISNLTEDVYSWHELPYTYPHWLYDLCIFLVYNSFGHQGIFYSTMILNAILGISVYVLCNKKSKDKVVSLVLTLGAMYLVKSFVAARAQLVTFILFVWAILAIEKFLETKKLRYALLLILIPLLITNLHCAVFPFYFILFLPYIGEYLLLSLEDADLDYKLFRRIFMIKKKFAKTDEKKAACDRKIARVEEEKNERIRKRNKIRENPYKVIAEKNHVVLLLIAVMAIAVLTGFLNPAGTGAYTYLVKTLQGNTTQSINEHLPLTLVDNTEFAVALVIYILVLTFTDSKIRLSDVFMLGGITFLAFNSRRQVSMFALFCVPILAGLIGGLVYKYDKETFKKIEKWIAGWFGATVVICLCIIWCTRLIKPTLRENFVDFTDYPVDAATWILENLDVENIRPYNEYNYGAYLLFRGVPVFIDSRCDLYSPEFNGEYNKETKEYDGRDIFSDALDIAGLSLDYKREFKEYDVTHAILFDNSKLAKRLEEDAEYKEIYRDDYFVIFERLTAKTAQEAQQAVLDATR